LKNNFKGISRDEHFKSNSFNASLWLSESFPLNLREQIFNVIDLVFSFKLILKILGKS